MFKSILILKIIWPQKDSKNVLVNIFPSVRILIFLMFLMFLLFLIFIFLMFLSFPHFPHVSWHSPHDFAPATKAFRGRHTAGTCTLHTNCRFLESSIACALVHVLICTPLVASRSCSDYIKEAFTCVLSLVLLYSFVLSRFLLFCTVFLLRTVSNTFIIVRTRSTTSQYNVSRKSAHPVGLI